MDRDLRMDPFFHFTAAKLASKHGLEDLSTRFEAKAIAAMQRQVRWDFPRTAGRMTSVIVRYYLSREELLEAGRWSCYAFGEESSRYNRLRHFRGPRADGGYQNSSKQRKSGGANDSLPV